MITFMGAGRSHGRAVGGAGAVVAEGSQGRASTAYGSGSGPAFRGGRPVEYGPWNGVYDLFRRWQRDGTWHRVLTRLQSLADAKGAIT